MNPLEMEQIAFVLVRHVHVLALAFPALALVQVEVLIK
jgi:hypothetical protein